MNTKEVERDEFVDFQPRDLLTVSESVLKHPMLMAIVESGQSPKDCYGYMKRIGFSDDTAYRVKAAVRAKLEIQQGLERSRVLNPSMADATAQVWSLLRSTQDRPSSIFLFPDMGREYLTPCEGVAFGRQAVDRQRWPYLLQEFIYRPPMISSQYPAPLTTFDYDGSHFLRLHQSFRAGDEWDNQPYGPKSVRGTDGSWSYELFDGTVPVLYWSMEHASYGCLVSSYSNVLPSTDPLCPFPRCYKLVKIEKALPDGGQEMIKIKVRQDFGPEQGSAMHWKLGEVCYQRSVPLSGLLEIKLVLKYSIDRDMRIQWNYQRGDDFILTGFSRKPETSEQLGRELFRRVSFVQAGESRIHEDLTKLGHRILSSEPPPLERVAGRPFLDRPPANLSDLFITS